MAVRIRRRKQDLHAGSHLQTSTTDKSLLLPQLLLLLLLLLHQMAATITQQLLTCSCWLRFMDTACIWCMSLAQCHNCNNCHDNRQGLQEGGSRAWLAAPHPGGQLATTLLPALYLTSGEYPALQPTLLLPRTGVLCSTGGGPLQSCIMPARACSAHLPCAIWIWRGHGLPPR